MKFYIIYLFCLFSIIGIAQSNFQNDSVSKTQIKLLNSEYKDFVSVKNKLYAISQNNDLIEIDLKKDNFKLIKNNITAIAKKSNNELVFGSKDGRIFILNNKHKVNQIEKIDAEIFSVLINSKDEYIIYSNKSIYYNRKDYIPKKETNFYGKVRAKYTGKQLIEPDFIYLDRMNFIWFAYDEGEWGGNVYYFDLNKKEFIYDDWLRLDDGINYKDRNEYFTKLKEKYPEIIKVIEKDTVYKYPYSLGISSVTKGATYNNKGELFTTSSDVLNSIYATRNGFHYFVDGTIKKITNKDSDYYTSCFDQDILEAERYKIAFERNFMGFKNKDRELRENILTENEVNILGYISYNKYDSNLYFFSSKGFYTLNNLDCSFSKKLFFNPKLICNSEYEKDYCLHLNVIKFEFISEKEIIFLTKNDGIGYYNGESIKYFR
ncbi:hypothetical protein SY27_00925 [Flavobacterium sp. 316]|uniref:hypothetical protein n=1 Tax=Flavobacterium sp. 316 TaxID=1603293 RepID=UPI0005DD028A|nr:hypothetical protein [Flavobacterium sp. 316]KIX22446.1 hypothetical protein SY27_00925 [Flavobacterium sp. 316]